MNFFLQKKSVFQEKLFYAVLPAFILFLLYLPGLDYPFMLQWDDAVFITQNPNIDITWENIKFYFTKPFQDLYTPLPLLSLMLDHALFGQSTTGYHLHNILLHYLCCLFFFLILCKFKIRPLFAFAGTLLWAINPQKIESVIWITERKDVLSGLFAAASFYFFLRSTEKKTIPAASTVLAVLALLSKPSVLPLPGVMTVYLICVWGKRHSLKEYAKILLLPLTVSMAVILISAQITARTFPGGFEWRLPLWIHNIFWYPLTAVFPEVHPFYPPYLNDWKPYIPVYIAGILVACLLIFWAKKISLPEEKVIGFFLVTGGLLVPVLGIIVYTYYDQADRYNYLVSMGVWTFLICLCEKTVRQYPKMKKSILILLFSASGVYFVYSWLYLPYWEKCEYLFARSLEDTRPSNIMFYDNGAIAAYASGNHKLLQAISDKMIRDHKAYKDSEALYVSGLAYGLHAAVIRKDYKNAMPFYRKLDALYKTKGGMKLNYWPYFFHNMAVMAAQKGDDKKAEDFLRIFFRIYDKNKHPVAIFHNAAALQAQMRKDEKTLIFVLRIMKKYDPQLSNFTPIVREPSK